MHGYDPLPDARHGFDEVLSVVHLDDGKDSRTRFGTDSPQAFLTRRTVRDSYMPAVRAIDLVHHLPELRTVGRYVL